MSEGQESQEVEDPIEKLRREQAERGRKFMSKVNKSSAPDPSSQPAESVMSRRGFLKLIGATSAAVTLAVAARLGISRRSLENLQNPEDNLTFLRELTNRSYTKIKNRKDLYDYAQLILRFVENESFTVPPDHQVSVTISYAANSKGESSAKQVTINGAVRNVVDSRPEKYIPEKANIETMLIDISYPSKQPRRDLSKVFPQLSGSKVNSSREYYEVVANFGPDSKLRKTRKITYELEGGSDNFKLVSLEGQSLDPVDPRPRLDRYMMKGASPFIGKIDRGTFEEAERILK